MRRTPEQRRAYIETSRRSQPIEELLRKAKKANRRSFRRHRSIFSGMEGIDYSFAFHEGHAAIFRERVVREGTFKLTFCNLCSSFAQVGEVVQHKTRCSANPIDDGPYPGWEAAGGR